jgi:hypothetical protein
MSDAISQLFEDDQPAPKYPGSKRVLKQVAVKQKTTAKVSKAIELFDPANWGHKPFLKKVGGKDVELYTIGALAAALERPLITIRLWENKGYLPPAPFRVEHKPGKGGSTGRRFYTKEAIIAALEEFHKRGLLGVPRIEWSEHEDLPKALAERWSQIVEAYQPASS